MAKMASLETVFYEQKPREVRKGVGSLVMTTCEGTKCVSKSGIFYGNLGNLGFLGTELEILNLYNKEQVVRKIKVTEDEVIIDFMDKNIKPISFSKVTPVYYEPWFMDRGSYVIWVDDFKTWGKLATEGDPARVIK